MSEENKPPICHFKSMSYEVADDWPNGQVGYWICKQCGHTKENERHYEGS